MPLGLISTTTAPAVRGRTSALTNPGTSSVQIGGGWRTSTTMTVRGEEGSASQSVTGIVTSHTRNLLCTVPPRGVDAGIAVKAPDYAEVPVTVQPVIQP